MYYVLYAYNAHKLNRQKVAKHKIYTFYKRSSFTLPNIFHFTKFNINSKGFILLARLADFSGLVICQRFHKSFLKRPSDSV